MAKSKLEVLVDDSEKSKNVLEALDRRGVKYAVIFSCSTDELPALRTDCGTIRGYSNIATYFLSDLPYIP